MIEPRWAERRGRRSLGGAEVRTARNVLERALEGAPGVLVVGGEAGVGRTHLVEAISGLARTLGFRVTTGTCLRTDAGAILYSPIVAVLRGLVRGQEPALVAAQLGAYRREIARLLPAVARLATPVGSETGPGPVARTPTSAGPAPVGGPPSRAPP